MKQFSQISAIAIALTGLIASIGVAQAKNEIEWAGSSGQIDRGAIRGSAKIVNARGEVSYERATLYVKDSTKYFDQDGKQITPRQFQRDGNDGVRVCVVYSKKEDYSHEYHAVEIHCLFKRPANARWEKLPGSAYDIDVGADGSAWAIGTLQAAQGGERIYKWNGKNWEEVDGGGRKIAVGPTGNPWVINDKNEIYRRVGDVWKQLPGSAVQIDIGADGSVWIIGTKFAPMRTEDFLSAFYRFSRGPRPKEDTALSDLLKRVWHAAKAGEICGDELDQLRTLIPADPESAHGFAYLKPNGYAGCYETIDRVYRYHTGLTQESLAWDRYFHAQPATQAVRNRKEYFKRWLAARAFSTRSWRLLNLACGPCRDVCE